MLHTSRISFPGLGIGNFDVNSVAFTIFGKEVAWYGLIITLGIMFCFMYITLRTRNIGLTFDDVVDVGLITVIMGILGGRAYYVLTSLEYYDSFWQFFEIWNGGIGIYGGLIAGAITVFIMCKFKKIKFNAFADCTCPSILFAQMAGRWGNFFNGEAFGSQTNWFCRMGLQNANTFYKFGTAEMVYVHPTFLYESLWNLIGFTLASVLFKRRKYDGFIFHFCFAWYGFGRMFIELLRTDSLYISSYHAWFTKISVLVGFAAFVIFGSLMVYSLIKYYRGNDETREKMKPLQMTRNERLAYLENLEKGN